MTEENRNLPVSKGEAAKTSSAKSRVNIPFNLNNWKERSEEEIESLSWFHQHLLEKSLSYKDAVAAIGYSNTTIYRILHGTYEGNWGKVISSIQSYRKLSIERDTIKYAEFRETSITKLIAGGLSYALQNNCITTIIGESRMGKTATAKWWRDHNNHGRTVYVTAPAYGGAKALLREVAYCLGINRNTSISIMHESILRAFNKNRILIVDEAHRLLPNDRKANPVQLEILRDIHDRTECGLALVATERFADDLSKSNYQFEQLLGRIEMPIRLPRNFTYDDILPIITQYVPHITVAVRDELLKIANNHGRLGILCGTLKVANKLAAKEGIPLESSGIMKAIKLRQQMMGETQFARK